ncbi:hypothetical protein ACHAQI_006261 [Fusarium lateritium]
MGPKRYRKEYSDPEGQGFYIRIWDISSKASKSDIEDLLLDHGFSTEVHWPETEAEGPYGGWCRVDFECEDEANNAKTCLNRKFVQGVSIRTGPVYPVSAPRRIKKKDKKYQPVASEETSLAILPPSPDVAPTSVPTITRSPDPLVGTSKSPSGTFAPSLSTREWNENDPKQCHEELMTTMTSVEAKYDKLGVINRPIVMTLPDGRQTLRPLLSSNNPTGELFTYVQKVDGTKEFKKVPLAQLALPSDTYMKKIKKLGEMEPVDSPTMSTASIFPQGIKASGLAMKVFPGEEKPAGAISLTQPKITREGARDELELDESEKSPEFYWQPGRLLGPDDQKRAIISHSPTFTSLSKMDPELLSATSRSHTIRHGRPAGVGLGWGGFDRFREWQQFGRQVSKSMFEEKEWQKPNDAIAMFKSEKGDGIYVIPTHCNKIHSLKGTRRLGSMWKRLNKSTKKEERKKKREKNAAVPDLLEEA